MLVQDVLHFAWPDLVPGHVDLILFAVHDVEPALGVHIPDVTGPQPAAPQRLLGLFGLLPVAGHHLRAFGDQLAHLAGGQLGAVLTDDANHSVENRNPDRKGAGCRINRGVPTQGHGMGRGGGFRQSVDVMDIGAEPALESVTVLGGIGAPPE